MRRRKPVLPAAADDLVDRVGARLRQAIHKSRNVRLEAAHKPQRRLVTRRKVELGRNAAGKRFVELKTPFDDLVTPVSAGLGKTGIFELQEMLDDVLDERLRRSEIAAPQILDLLGDMFAGGLNARSNSACRCVQA
jgi:hypothetical protein